MFKKNTKRIISLGLSFILALVLTIGVIPSEKVYAASFSDINQGTMFFKQNTSSTCTLASAAMLVRRAALLNGNSNWTEVTENNLKSTAWTSGGLRNSFSYAGINVSSARISSNRTQTMINLLSQHPEGIVIYDFGKPHAILLTDYTDGTFYCADPSSAAPAGRIPISRATITLESIDKYWYVASPKLSMSVVQPVNIKPTVGTVQIMSSGGYTSYSCQVTIGMGGARATVEYTRDGVTSNPVPAEIVNGTVSGGVGGFSSTLTVKVTVTDQAGNTASNSSSVDFGEPIRLSANQFRLAAGESDQIQLFCADLYEVSRKHGSSCRLSDGRTAVEISDEGVVSAYLPGHYALRYCVGYVQYNPPGSMIQPAMAGEDDYGIIVDVHLESPVVQTLSADTAGNVYLDFSDARGADGYEICRMAEDGTISDTIRVTGSGKQCVGHDLSDCTRWKYKVRAYTVLPEENSVSGRCDPATNTWPDYMPEETIYSDWTQEYDISTINLATTMEQEVKNVPGSVTVSWKEVSSAEGYLVYRTAEKSGADRKLLTKAKAEETSYTDSTVIPGVFYRYEVIPYLGEESGTCKDTVSVCAKEKEKEEVDTESEKEEVVADSVYLAEGFTKKLPVNSGEAVQSWSSSNKKVATVDSRGKVTAKKKGKAVISAKLENGRVLKYKITVVKNIYSVEKIRKKDFKKGEWGLEVYKGSFDTKGNLVIKARAVSRLSDKISSIQDLKIVIKDGEGKTVGTYKKKKIKTSIAPGGFRDFTFVIKKSGLKKKKVQLPFTEITVSAYAE